MVTKPIALVGLAAVMLAAGAGSYVAVRQNATPPYQGDAADTAIQPRGITEAAQPLAVEATEATVGMREPSTEATSTREAPAPTVAPAPPARAATAPSAPAAASPAPTREMPRSEPAPRTEPPASSGALPDTDTARSAEPHPVPAATVRVPQADPAPASAPASAPTTSAESDRAVETAPRSDPASGQSARNERAAADVPAVEGWSRVSSDTPPETEVSAPLDTRPLINESGSGTVPPAPVFVEYEIAADSVIGLQMETGVSTRTAEVEDSVEARVTRDVLVADEVVVPAGTRVLGSVVLVEQGGKLRDASRLGIRFHTLVMDEGTRVSIVTETIYRDAAPKGRDSVGKVGGAILGAIFGGARGAAIGGSIGAAGGTAAAVSTEAEPAGLPPGSPLTVRLSRPAIVAVAP